MSKYVRNIFQTVTQKKTLENMDINELVCFIQPLWNKYNMGKGKDNMTETEITNLTTSMKVYKEQELDMGYFMSGFGVPITDENCIIS